TKPNSCKILKKQEIEGTSRHNQQLYLSISLAYQVTSFQMANRLWRSGQHISQTALQRLCNAGAPVYLGDKTFCHRRLTWFPGFA
ncbi:hypothetical protein MKW98_007507, partial [Papaver atlanticum]